MSSPNCPPRMVVSWALILILFYAVGAAEAAVTCSTNRECRHLLHPASKCDTRSWTCTNPFASGCLHTLLGLDAFPNRRVCNSDDIGADTSNCDLPDPNFNYTEVRIAPGNWESAMFNAYILQILLSELLGVPCTLETGDDITTDKSHRLMSFYDADNGFPYPSQAYQFESLEVANDHGGDCIAARTRSGHDEKTPKSCAHLIPEVRSRLACVFTAGFGFLLLYRTSNFSLCIYPP